jgi:carboxymethylenebutenolidase
LRGTARRRVEAEERHLDVRRDRRANHDFHADYRPSYKADAAADAWKRCNAWLKKNLA